MTLTYGGLPPLPGDPDGFDPTYGENPTDIFTTDVEDEDSFAYPDIPDTVPSYLKEEQFLDAHTLHVLGRWARRRVEESQVLTPNLPEGAQLIHVNHPNRFVPLEHDPARTFAEFFARHGARHDTGLDSTPQGQEIIINGHGIALTADVYAERNHNIAWDPNLMGALHDPYTDAVRTLASVYGLGEALSGVGRDVLTSAFNGTLEANNGRLNPRDIPALFNNLQATLQEHASHNCASNAELALLDTMHETQLRRPRFERLRSGLGRVAAYLTTTESQPARDEAFTDSDGYVDLAAAEATRPQGPRTILSPDIARLVDTGYLTQGEAEDLFLAPVPSAAPQGVYGLIGTGPLERSSVISGRHDADYEMGHRWPTPVRIAKPAPRPQPGRHAAKRKLSATLKGWKASLHEWYLGLSDTENLLQR